MDPLRELETVAAQYEKYLELSQVNSVERGVRGFADPEFLAPRPAPLTLTLI